MFRLGFIKTTLFGGLVFLVPFVALLIIVGKAIQLMRHVAAPIGRLVPIETVGGVALVNIIAILLIAIVCFAAGLISKSSIGKGAFRVTDAALISFVPVYAILKERLFIHFASDDIQKVLKPVLVTFDDHAMLAFEVERTPSGLVSIFLPGCPDPWAGSSVLVANARVSEIDVSAKEVHHMLKKMGIGSADKIVIPDALAAGVV